MRKNLYPDHCGKVVFLLSMAFFTICSFRSKAQTVNTQVINTIAGSGLVGYSGNFSAAILARLDSPTSVALDPAGNIYISDQNNNCIRKVTPALGSIIQTIAGTGTASFGGDNGPATLAKLNLNWGVAVDGKGNVFVSDEQNQRIRKIDASGTITTIAGNDTAGYSGDGGPATAAQIHYPLGIAVDGSGNVYFGDSYNFCVRKIDPSGIITTIAGSGISGFYGDSGPATMARLSNVWGVAADGPGNVYICDAGNHRVRKVSTSGVITTIAGTGTPGYNGDHIPAATAWLNVPLGVVAAPSGDVYIADYADNRIRKIDVSGMITTVAGTGTQGYNGDGILATTALLSRPISIAVDDSANVYISDLDNIRIRKISNINIVSFLNGRFQHVIACENTSTSMNAVLSIVDYDAGATDHWNLVSPPHHGTVSVTYSATSIGGKLTPSGMTYDPDTGYIGDDTFVVSVSNGIASDTTNVYVSVNTLFPSAGIVSGPPYVCEKSAVTLSDPVTGGVWSCSNGNASVSASGAVTGITAGTDTVIYTYNNSCAIAAASKTMTVEPLPDAGRITGASAVCAGSTISVTDTTAGGSWSCSNSKATIDSGLITGISAGVDSIYYTVSDSFCSSRTMIPIVVDTFTNIGTLSGDTGVCVGARITLADAAVRGGIWTSSNSSASVSSGIIIGVKEGSDTISYSITNSCGTAMASKVIEVFPLPVVPVINRNEYVLSTSAGYSSYQWQENGKPISNAISDTCIATNAGSYIVVVTNNYGCPVSSLPVTTPDCSPDEIRIFPNPTQSIIYVKWCKKLTINLIAMNGKLLNITNNGNEADLRFLPNGDYLLSVFDENGTRIKTACVSKIEK